MSARLGAAGLAARLYGRGAVFVDTYRIDCRWAVLIPLVALLSTSLALWSAQAPAAVWLCALVSLSSVAGYAARLHRQVRHAALVLLASADGYATGGDGSLVTLFLFLEPRPGSPASTGSTPDVSGGGRR